jgi:hypothetical protein
MPVKIHQVFALCVDGKPTLTFEARNIPEARQLSKEPWLRADLRSQQSNRFPLCGVDSKLSVRRANNDEAEIFDRGAQLAKPWEGRVLAYLVELDGFD